MADAGFDLERLRLQAAHSLPAGCFDDFQRLSRSLLHGPDFQWLLVDAPHEGLRAQVMLALDGVLKAAGMATNRLPLSDKIADVAALERRLVNNAAKAAVVHVIGRQGWFNASRWDAFNVRRERIAAGAKARLVFWLDAEAIALVSQGAPDLWAWRAGIYAFLPESVALGGRFEVATPTPLKADSRSMSERFKRIAEIRSWLVRNRDAPDDLIFSPLDELGRLLFDIGDFDAALKHWQEAEMPIYERRGDLYNRLTLLAQIATVHHLRGDDGAALKILTEEVLTGFKELGATRDAAVASVQIADSLNAQGRTTEALETLERDALPTLERLGDHQQTAVALSKIAEILVARGNLEKALDIFRGRVLKLFERLGDTRAAAITWGNIADIHQLQGRLDDALRIRAEAELPVYERLGDLRGVATARFKIAVALQIRGQVNEALALLRDKTLPIFEKLGAQREIALTQGHMGELLLNIKGSESEGRVLIERAKSTLVALGVPNLKGRPGSLMPSDPTPALS